MNNNIKTRGVSLFFDESSSCSTYLSVPMNVKKIVVKQLGVINTDGSTSNVPIGFLKSDIITSDQVLAVINTEISTSYNIDLNTKLIPSSNNISGFYNFFLTVNDQTGLVGDPTLQIYINLLLEFQEN